MVREIKVTWKIAWLTIIAHGRICCRITLLLLLAARLLAWSLEYMSDFSLLAFWQQYKVYIIVTVLTMHFGPVNVYALKRLANKSYAGRYYVKVFER